MRTEDESEAETSYQFSLNYITKFNEEGHQLTADLQYGKETEGENSLIDERNTFPTSEVLPSEFVTTDETENEYLAQIDYVLPIGENAQFEAGYRGNFEETVTDYELTEQMAAGGNFVRNDSLSNIFTYNENVNAIYTQYGNKFGKFSFLAGLRFEHTQLKGSVDAESVETNDNDQLNINFDNSYTGFPNA